MSRKSIRQARRLFSRTASAAIVLTTATMAAKAAQGPGLGNLSYSGSELFTQISSPLIDDTTGLLPPDYPGKKHFGVNVMTMLNGYMVGVFAPDSGGGPGGWIALDASDPRNLVLVKTVYEPDTTNANRTGDDRRTSEFREPHSFGLAEGNLIAIQTGKGIEIWDWSDVNNPIQVSKLPIPNVDYGDYNSVSWQLFWQAPYLYVSRGNDGLSIVDTSNVSQPVLVKTVPTSQLGGFNVGPLFALGNELFLSSMEGTAGFSIVNISDPENPVLAKTISSLPQKYYSSCWDGEKAFFGARAASDKLRVYDTTQNPMVLLNDDLAGFVNLYCNLQDHKLLLGNQDDISILNAADINSMTVEGTASLDAADPNVDHGQVFPFGNLVWVGNDHGTGSGLIAKETGQDLLPPLINRTVPGHLAANQPLSSRIGVALSDSVLMESVNSNTFAVTKLGTSSPLTGRYSVNLGFVHFTPSAPLEADQIYEVTLNGISDFAGNLLPQQTFRFSTGETAEHNINANVASQSETFNSVSMSAFASPILGGSVEYSWSFGDGSASTPFSSSGSAVHSYNSPGHYSAIVTVRESGVESSASQRVTVYNPLTSNAPTKTSTITNDGARVYVVNEDNDTVSAISGVAPFTKQWETSVGDRPRTLAVAPDGRIWVATEEGDAISILSSSGVLVDSIPMGRGSRPYGVVFSPNQDVALVSLQGTGELVKVDAATGTETDRLFVGKDAHAIAITADSATAFVTRFISPQSQAEVIEVDVSSLNLNNTIALSKDTTTIDGPDRSRGIPNYLSDVSIAPDGLSAWIAANKANVDRGPYLETNPQQRLTFETTIRAMTTQIDLSMGQEDTSQRLDIDNRAQPKAIEFSALGDYVYIALEGQNSIEIRDAYSKNRAGELVTNGFAPRGISKVGNHLFAHNFMSRSVSVFDVSQYETGSGSATQLASISTVANESLHPRVLAGKQIFYNAADARMTMDGYLSCASCHSGGESDNRVWDFTDRNEGLRNTISLVGRTGTGLGNVHWTANFDEIQDFENDIRYGFGGRGFLDDVQFAGVSDPLGNPKAGMNDDLDNLAFYVGSLNQFPKSPFRNQNGSLTAEAQAGEQLFSQKGCVACHSGDFYTDNQRHDVGTIEASSGLGIGQPLTGIGFETPTLLGLFDTAPYFHNGQAATLDDVLQIGSEHQVSNSGERAQLVAYLQQLEYEGPEIVVPDPLPASQFFYLSDLQEQSGSVNGWGAFEKDSSNGEEGSNDGGTLTIGGAQFEKGLGVHAYSEIVYDISDRPYDRFEAVIGVDDETGSNGSVIFKVYVDNVPSFESGIKTGADVGESLFLELPVNASQLRLEVTNAGDGDGSDHADWANARLRLPGQVAVAEPGLFYGTLAGSMNVTGANPATSVTIDLAETETSIAQNTTKVFSGYLYDADGNISFVEYIDDNTRLWIDGNLVLTSNDWQDQVATGNLSLSPGWHSFELRIGNANGPGGPTGAIGFGYDPDGGSNWVHAADDGSGSLFSTAIPSGTPDPEVFDYASDLTESNPSNGWGPIEKDSSNGEASAGDGLTLTVDGQTFSKGLGVHADSSLEYSFAAGTYDRFIATIGIDDEVGNSGSVVFQVQANGNTLYTSTTLTGSSSAEEISVDLPANTTQLVLLVNDAGDGNGYDHADWADARLRRSN